MRNHGSQAIDYRLGSREFTIRGESTSEVSVDVESTAVFSAYQLALESEGWPDLHRTVFLYNPDGSAEWSVLKSNRLSLRAALDGCGAELLIDGKVAAVITPLVHYDGVVKPLNWQVLQCSLFSCNAGLMGVE